MRGGWVAVFGLVGACAFDPSGFADDAGRLDGSHVDASATDASASDAAAVEWWDPAYPRRVRVTVTTGPNVPFHGYEGYTVRLIYDTATLVSEGWLQPDCDDLRVVFWDGAAWQELPRHLLGCNAAASDLRFALRADIAANDSDDQYYLYFGNPAAPAPAPLAPTDVYLWRDDASSDRLGSYDTGRVDTWGSTNTWVQKTSWNAAGYYDYQTLDDEVSSFRRPVAERDVYAEVELFHTNCYPSNMVTGVILRGIIASGTAGSETADHYYLSQRGHQAECGAGYLFDGDVIETERGIVAIDGPNPAALPRSQWRKQALAAWGINPTQINFWDDDAGWPNPGWPAGPPQTSGADADDYEGFGFAGIWIAQDEGRFRGMLIRRYVEPEPTAVAGPALLGHR